MLKNAGFVYKLTMKPMNAVSGRDQLTYDVCSNPSSLAKASVCYESCEVLPREDGGNPVHSGKWQRVACLEVNFTRAMEV